MSKKKNSQKEDFKEEEISQAVVIADSFNVRFAPITKTKPRALIPMVNVPLLDYTLEFLCSAGIEQVIIFTSIHADQIKQHVRASKWMRESSPCQIITIVSEQCRSLGDALRDIDAKNLIKSDFVLVNGDIVANLKLKPIIEEHKRRRKSLKTPVMTMLFKCAPPAHRTRCREEEVLVAVRPDTSRLLHYEKVGGTSRFNLDLALFQDNHEVALRYDLLDSHVSICSPVVPCLFTDEFDYQTRDDFVRGILVNEEILGNSIHVHVTEKEYAARVSNLQMYDAISKDIINRWSYPLVPDGNMSNLPENYYIYGRHNIYLHKDVTLARGCELVENVVIGKGTTVGSNTHITNSVIGKNCRIGENVHLDGAYIWDGVVIDDSCHIPKAVLADEVHLLSNVRLEPGCVLSYKVRVGPDVVLPAGTMLMAEKPQVITNEFEDEFGELEEASVEMAAEIDPQLVGDGGFAYVYCPPADSDEEDGGLPPDPWGLTILSEDEAASSDEEEGDDLPDGSDMPDGDLVVDDVKVFHDEVRVTLERALNENIGFDNMVLEINSLKHAYNIQIKEVNMIVTKACCEIPLGHDPDVDTTKYLTKFKAVMKKMILPLLRNYIKSRESQLNCLQAMEDLSLTSPTVSSCLLKMLHSLYDHEILSEEAILKWHGTAATVGPDIEARKTLRKQVEPFIKWLEEAEEESESEED